MWKKTAAVLNLRFLKPRSQSTKEGVWPGYEATLLVATLLSLQKV